MPPKKRTSTEANMNAQDSAGKQKKSRSSTDSEESASEPQQKDQSEDNREPFGYYCIRRPFSDVERENDDKEEDEQLDEDELEEKYDEETKGDSDNVLKPASDFPNHRWIAMWDSWKTYCDYRREATYRCPDMFNMYIHNDFHGYGMQELVENMLVSLDNEFKKKTHDEEGLKKMWAVSAAMGLWLVTEGLGPWFGMDDGDRLAETVDAVGSSFLTSLHELDRAGLLKTDPLKDLGLVMSLYLEFSSGLEDYGLDNPAWAKEIVAYAKKASVDLEACGCHGVGKRIQSLEEEHGEIRPLANSATSDRWKWKKNLKKLKDGAVGGKLGGEKYNIVKFSRNERAKHAFDKKDPLAKFSDKDLKEGKLMIM